VAPRWTMTIESTPISPANSSAADPLFAAEQYAYTTVRIECLLKDGEIGQGTAFFFEFPRGIGQHLPVLITNRHVIEDSVSMEFRLRSKKPDGSPNNRVNTQFKSNTTEKDWIGHPDSRVDLAAFVVGHHISAMTASGPPPFFRACNPQVIPTKNDVHQYDAVEDVLMVGYPEGIWDSVNNLPIIRSGITATHPAFDYEDQKEFLIDVACFHGSSGSPVFRNVNTLRLERNGIRFQSSNGHFLGVLHAGIGQTDEGDVIVRNIPTAKRLVATFERFFNLGVVIKAERILEFDPLLPGYTPNPA
jgi:hypothetical protein